MSDYSKLSGSDSASLDRVGRGNLTTLSAVRDLGRPRVAKEWLNQPPLHASEEIPVSLHTVSCMHVCMHARESMS